MGKMSDNTEQKTSGRETQELQGHHGMLGAEDGAEDGTSILQKENYELWSKSSRKKEEFERKSKNNKPNKHLDLDMEQMLDVLVHLEDEHAKLGCPEKYMPYKEACHSWAAECLTPDQIRELEKKDWDTFSRRLKNYHKKGNALKLYHILGCTKGRKRFATDSEKQYNMPKSVMNKIAAQSWKIILNGGDLTTKNFKILSLKVALKHDIPILPRGKASEREIDLLLKIIINDTPFTKQLKKSIQRSKNQKLKKTFYPSANFQSRLARRYNLSFKKQYTTRYDLQSLKAELVPTLQQTYALRKAFHIPASKGRIWNIDESMTYRYDEPTRTWTI